MNYEIRNAAGEIVGMANDTKTAHVFAQALRKENRETDFTVHPI